MVSHANCYSACIMYGVSNIQKCELSGSCSEHDSVNHWLLDLDVKCQSICFIQDTEWYIQCFLKKEATTVDALSCTLKHLF